MAGPVTGHDVPTELFDKIVAFMPVDETKVRSSKWLSFQERHSITLVCLRWAQIYRPKLWDGRIIRILSWDQAQWFKWIATVQGSDRLIPVIDLLSYVDVAQDVEAPRSWLHLLYHKSSRAKLRNLEFIGRYRSSSCDMSPLGHSTPHLGVSKPLSPLFTPYKQVRLTNVSLPSPKNLAKLLSYFRHATDVWLDNVAYTGQPEDVVPMPRRPHHNVVRLVRSTLSQGRASELKPGFANLMTASIAHGRACPLMRSSELEQVRVRHMITNICEHVGRDDFDIQCGDGDELVIRIKYDLISLRYGPSPMGAEEKTVTRVCLSIASVQYRSSLRWYSKLPAILAQLLSIQEFVVNAHEPYVLESFLADPAIKSLARRPAISIHATYPLLDNKSPLSEKQPQAQLKGYAQVDPITLRPTGKLLSPREMLVLFQGKDIREGGDPAGPSGRAMSLDDILLGIVSREP